MAIKAEYTAKGLLIKNAYLKVTHVGMHDRKQNEQKVFLATANFEVKANAESEPIFNDMIHYLGDPNRLHHEQAYEELKKLYPVSTDI